MLSFSFPSNCIFREAEARRQLRHWCQKSVSEVLVLSIFLKSVNNFWKKQHKQNELQMKLLHIPEQLATFFLLCFLTHNIFDLLSTPKFSAFWW